MIERFFFNFCWFISEFFGSGVTASAAASTSSSSSSDDLHDIAHADIGKSLYTAFEFGDD